MIELELPPFRHRPVDIADLARHIAWKAAPTSGRPEVPDFSADVIAALEAHSWPGNIREPETLVRRAIALGGSGAIRARGLDLPVPGGSGGSDAETLDEVIQRRNA